jgi:hypothetical protein
MVCAGTYIVFTRLVAVQFVKLYVQKFETHILGELLIEYLAAVASLGPDRNDSQSIVGAGHSALEVRSAEELADLGQGVAVNRCRDVRHLQAPSARNRGTGTQVMWMGGNRYARLSGLACAVLRRG